MPREKDTTLRMQGQQAAEARGAQVVRYNPAYAGTTCVGLRGRAAVSIQPCVCRDNHASSHEFALDEDTTLRMQGQPAQDSIQAADVRYNPAYAGTTRAVGAGDSCGSIQPCVCRDNSDSSFLHHTQEDTTLRMQGQLPFQSIADGFLRYNPAYAGTTKESCEVGH